ncbi:MAG: hypothetical protein J6R40_00605 [Clostridia bacterium]|nr:hypothetical protein [Clostridia bacterium]
MLCQEKRKFLRFTQTEKFCIELLAHFGQNIQKEGQKSLSKAEKTAPRGTRIVFVRQKGKISLFLRPRSIILHTSCARIGLVLGCRFLARAERWSKRTPKAMSLASVCARKAGRAPKQKGNHLRDCSAQQNLKSAKLRTMAIFRFVSKRNIEGSVIKLWVLKGYNRRRDSNPALALSRERKKTPSRAKHPRLACKDGILSWGFSFPYRGKNKKAITFVIAFLFGAA